MINKFSDVTQDFSKVATKKVLIYSLAQRMVLGISTGLVGPLIPIIAKDLNIGLDKIGATISFSILAILITAIVLNNFIDNLGFKKVLIAGLVFLSSGALGIFLSKTFIFFIVFYFIYQLGIGILSITIFSIIGGVLFEEKSRRIMQTSIYYSMGVIIAPLLVSLFIGVKLNWQLIFLSLVIIQIMLGIFLISIKIPKIIKPKKNIKNLFSIDKKIIFNSFFIIIGFMIFLYSAVMVTFFTWFTSYFESLNIEVFKSSLFLALYSMSLFIGLIIKNQLIRKVEEKKLLMWGILLSFVFMILIFFIRNLIIKNIMLFFYGICITANFSFMVILSLNLGSKYASSIAAYTHAAAYLGSIIFQYVSGFMSEHFSKNSVFYIDILLLFIIFILAIVINNKKMKTS
ncbi:MAG: MFS transporter [Actinobacteria bacterium]|nr:MFS transporter [Actinomycetota bacterium]MCG2788782.1 MFS transporter [Actinomycetes bacterium]